MIVLNLTVGGVTPPVGRLMYMACSALEVRLQHFTVEGMPLILALIAVLMLISFFPQLVLFLPDALMG